MLRCNIDTKTGLVNGALGTVLSISSKRVTVQFDHVSKPYNVDKVQTKFMVMKNFYVYRAVSAYSGICGDHTYTNVKACP